MPLSRRAFLQTAAAFSQAGPQPPNVVVLFADDMGYGDLACYGHPIIKTPNLDRLAEEGIRLTSFYAAASVCTPSRAGLLTGRNPVRAGQANNLGPDSKGGLPLTEILLPQLLKKRGYLTAAIGKWHLGHDPKEHLPTSRGFDSYLGLLYSNDMIPPFVQTTRPLYLYKNEEPMELMTDQSNLTRRYTDEAVRFIRSSAGRPFFLYLPYAMPHLPISAPKGTSSPSGSGLYGDVIETLDRSVGQILATLQERGLEKNTLVVFASDNGPWHDLPARMLQRGNEPWHTGSKSLLRGAKGTTYEGGIRVPGIIRWPGTIPPRQVSSQMASTLDLLPTILAAAGGDLPADRVYDGHNLLPFLKGQSPSPRQSFAYFLGPVLEGIRDGSWKFRLAPAGDPQGSNGPVTPELFHLDYDPSELYNVYARNRPLGDQLQAKMQKLAAELHTRTHADPKPAR